MKRHGGKIFKVILSGFILVVVNCFTIANEVRSHAVNSSDLLQVQSVFAPIVNKNLTGKILVESVLRCVWERFPDIRDINTPLTPEINGTKIKLNFEKTKRFNHTGNLLVNCFVLPAGEKHSLSYEAAINPRDGGIMFHPGVFSDTVSKKRSRGSGFKTMNVEGLIPSALRVDGMLLKQMDEKDIGDIIKIISSPQEELGEFIVASEGRIVQRGRTVYIKLRKVLQYQNKIITMMRLKGVCPEVDYLGKLTIPHSGSGFVERGLHLDLDGNIFVKFGSEDLKPEGTMFYRTAENEFIAMRDMESTEDVKTDIPVGIGKYELTFNSKEVGYVICGVEGEDIRITDSLSKSFAETKNFILTNSATKEDVHVLNSDEGMVLFREIGRTFRNYHDKGYYHRYPHRGNIGVVKKDGVFEVILRDLETVVTATEKDTIRQKAGFRFLDVGRVIYDLQVTRSIYTEDDCLNTDFSEFILPFLKGYFHDLDVSGSGFDGMLTQCMDRFWAGFYSGFEFSARRGQLVGTNLRRESGGIIDRENLSEENPYFGKMMALLYELEEYRDDKNNAETNVLEINEFKETLSFAEALSAGLVANTESILLTRPVIFAFDENIAGFQSASPMIIFEELKRLKKCDKFREILKDFTILDSRSPKVLIREIRQECLKYSDDKKPEVFIFSRVSEKEKFTGIASDAKVHTAYINEQDLPSDYYYPLVEIVTITLSRFLTPEIYTPGVISKLLEELDVNLGLVKEDNFGSLIFTLIPKAGRYSKRELITRYAVLKRLLVSA